MKGGHNLLCSLLKHQPDIELLYLWFDSLISRVWRVSTHESKDVYKKNKEVLWFTVLTFRALVMYLVPWSAIWLFDTSSVTIVYEE
jgi:hypothetical protein